MKQILILLLLVPLSMLSCKKEATEKPLPPIEISSIKADDIWKGDICGREAKYIDYYLANNRWTVEGKNFGDLGKIDCSDMDIDVREILYWSDTKIVFETASDKYDTFNNPVTFFIDREDDSKPAETKYLNIIGDHNGYAFGSPTGNVINHFIQQKIVVPDDFLSDLQICDASYEPADQDVVEINRQLYIIMGKPSIVANGFQRKYTFGVKGWDCKGDVKEFYAIFITKTDGEVIATENMPTRYLQF
jgi:hypothetical protein